MGQRLFSAKHRDNFLKGMTASREQSVRVGGIHGHRKFRPRRSCSVLQAHMFRQSGAGDA